MTSSTKLPRWFARNPSDRRQMIAWVNFMLDNDPEALAEIDAASADLTIIYGAINAEEMKRRVTPEEHAAFVAWAAGDGPAIDAAERGDIEPLRKKYPQLARYLQLPKRSGKGDRFPRDKMSDRHVRLALAAADVARIRAIWKKHYGKKNRSPAEISAEEIAARRWSFCDDISIDDVIRRAKKLR